jgi:hypothetical protein
MYSMKSALAVAVRPNLWFSAIGAVFAFSRRSWWKRFPFLPVSDPTVIDWRVTTAYGQRDMAIATEDILSYLRWRRRNGPWN